jgi:hypothetical protein
MYRTLKTFANRVGMSIGVSAALVLALGATTAKAAEVAPQISMMQHLLFISQSSDGSTDFDCFVDSYSMADGHFTCGSAISGRVVGVTNPTGVVTGHRIYLTRHVSSTVTENYVGAIAYDDAGSLYGLWMAGEYSTTTQMKRCTIGNPVCLTYNVFSGPRPFTGDAHLIGG